MSHVKQINEHLARAKGYFHRHDVVRCLLSLISATKALVEAPQVVGRDKQAMQMAMAELAQLLGRTEEAAEHMPGGYDYTRGQEKPFLRDTVTFYKSLDAAAKREQELQTQARKLQMDRLLLRAGKSLEAGKLGDAMQHYDEAVSLYEDEHIIFTMIARALLGSDAKGSTEAALPWSKRAVQADPNNSIAHLALGNALHAAGQDTEALAACQHGLAAVGEHPELLLLLAQLEEQAGQKEQALAHYQATLSHESIDYLMRKKAKAGIARLSP